MNELLVDCEQSVRTVPCKTRQQAGCRRLHERFKAYSFVEYRISGSYSKHVHRFLFRACGFDFSIVSVIGHLCFTYHLEHFRFSVHTRISVPWAHKIWVGRQIHRQPISFDIRLIPRSEFLPSHRSLLLRSANTRPDSAVERGFETSQYK